MRVYPEVPQWWYVAIGLVSVVFLFVAISVFPTQLPIWAAIIALIGTSLMALPLGMIQAITNQAVTLNVIFELIGGYMVPGKPVANMIFKAIGINGANQAITFSGNLKLGHYMKIPPRIMFTAQVVAAAVSCVVVTAVCPFYVRIIRPLCLMSLSPQVQEWMFSNIVDICTPGQKQGFVCPGTNAFANASLIWGGVGPRRLFSPGAM
jgi:OPT family oligopeptide transporter